MCFQLIFHFHEITFFFHITCPQTRTFLVRWTIWVISSVKLWRWKKKIIRIYQTRSKHCKQSSFVSRTRCPTTCLQNKSVLVYLRFSHYHCTAHCFHETIFSSDLLQWHCPSSSKGQWFQFTRWKVVKQSFNSSASKK